VQFIKIAVHGRMRCVVSCIVFFRLLLGNDPQWPISKQLYLSRLGCRSAVLLAASHFPWPLLSYIYTRCAIFLQVRKQRSTTDKLRTDIGTCPSCTVVLDCSSMGKKLQRLIITENSSYTIFSSSCMSIDDFNKHHCREDCIKLLLTYLHVLFRE
jgi:hypothetical protein